MRVFIAISIVVASVSSASAQLAMDHGQRRGCQGRGHRLRRAAVVQPAKPISTSAVAVPRRLCGGLPSS